MKNVPNGTKIVRGNKKCASVAHYGIELPPNLEYIQRYRVQMKNVMNEKKMSEASLKFSSIGQLYFD